MVQISMDFTEHEPQERIGGYVDRCGFWFASCDGYEEDARRAVASGFLQPVDPLLPIGRRDGNSRYFYVRSSLRSAHELPAGVYRHLVEGVPC